MGMEATGSMQWFLELMEEMGVECLVGHPAKIRAHEPRKQKNDRRDARLLMNLLAEDRFPTIWMPSVEQRDVRALLRHRHQWVRMRVRIQNALQSIALSHGLRRGGGLWSKDGQLSLLELKLPPHTEARRNELMAMYRQMQADIEALDHIVADTAEQRPRARLLMTHPGVGPITALATEVYLGDATRFADGKAVSSYVGDDSGGSFQRGQTPAVGSTHQARQCDAAGPVVRVRTPRGAPRCGTEALLHAQTGTEGTRESHRSQRAQARNPVMDYAAR